MNIEIGAPAVSSRGLLAAFCLCLAPALAQQAATAPSAADLAKYDVNHNGVLDPTELATLQADEARAAATPVGAQTSNAGETVQLSPFEVKEDNNGYFAGNTMSGTRLNTKLEDIGASISVVTKQQMTDFAMLDINDIFAYEASTEGTGNYTAYEIDRNGMVTDQIQNNPQGVNRVRGMGAANIALDNFGTSGRVPIDPINIDAIEISRGPNSNIFGLGEGSGTVNMVGASANFSRPFNTVELRGDDLGGWRTSLDLNRPLIQGKLGIRTSAVYQHTGYRRKPSGFDERRFNVMVRAQPWKNTSFRGSFQTYRGDGTRATAVTPRDGVSYWRSVGSPTWDPTTSIATVNGSPIQVEYNSRGNPTNMPPGLTNGENFVDPIFYVDDGGIQLWEIGRMPAPTATNGPANFNGEQRLVESQPDPIRTGHPLFSTVPGISDKSLYDWETVNLAAPNEIHDADDITTLQLDQYILNTDRNKLAFQLAWQRESSERVNRNIVGSASATGASYYLYVDPNEKLLDGRANPYFGRPYVGVGEPIHQSQPYNRDAYRGQAAYILDFTDSKKWTKWIGRQQLLGYYEEKKTESFRYRFRDAMIDENSIYAPAGTTKANQSTTNGFAPSPIATRGYYHFYVGDQNGANVDYAPANYALGDYDFHWYDPLAGQWVTDHNTLGESGITEGTAGNAGLLNVIKTKGAVLQSTFLDDRLITTFGRRKDENLNKYQKPPVLKANGYEFDYQAMDGWVGDWDRNSGLTKTGGAVIKPFRGWRFIENGRGAGGVKGFMSELLHGMTFYYNRSDSFLPERPAIGITMENLPNPTSVGKDYGFTINLGNKFVLRANRYQTKQINTRAGQSAIFAQRTLRVDFARFAGNNDAISLQRQATNWLTAEGLSGTALTDAVANVMGLSPDVVSTFNNNTISETSDVIASGNEFELNYNPDSNWTVRANLTRQQSIDANLSPHIPTWIAQRMPVWEKIKDPRTGNFWLDQAYSGDNPADSGQTPRSFLQGVVISPLAITTAKEGKKRAETREWHFNVSTNYRLAGLFDNQYLKRINVGGAVRWESKGAIGYYGVPIDGDYTIATELDANHPIYDKAHTYLDAFVGYTTRIYHDKWRARFQLNVRNLQESGRLQAVGAYPNGQPHTFRIIDPRTFIFTVTLDL